MVWVCLIGAGLALWALCGATIAIGRRIWSLQTTLYVHLAAAPVFAFALTALFGAAFPGLDRLLRAEVMTGLVVALDFCVVAPIFERSFAMFKSLVGTWLPFATIFIASWAA